MFTLYGKRFYIFLKKKRREAPIWLLPIYLPWFGEAIRDQPTNHKHAIHHIDAYRQLKFTENDWCLMPDNGLGVCASACVHMWSGRIATWKIKEKSPSTFPALYEGMSHGLCNQKSIHIELLLICQNKRACYACYASLLCIVQQVRSEIHTHTRYRDRRQSSLIGFAFHTICTMYICNKACFRTRIYWT